ncbi:MAG: MFS transporter [Propionibacteriaceae bacterium]
MTTSPDARSALAVVSRRKLAIGLCTAVVAIAFETIAVATAMPVAARDLQRIEWYAWAFSLFLIGQLFATVAGGRLSDRLGPSRPMIGGAVLFAIGLVVAGSAGHMVQLLAGRLIQGLGGGVMSVGIFVCIAQVFPERERPRMFSYISTAWVLPAFFGPPVSAWLTDVLSWHWVFFAVLPLLVFAAVMVVPSLVRLHRSERPDPDASPAPLWAAGVAAIAAAAIQLAGQRFDWWSLPLLAVGAAGLVLGLPRVMPPRFLRLAAGIPATIMTRGVMAGAFFGAESFVPLMLVELRHLPLVLAGATLTIGSAGWTVGAWVQSRPGIHLRRDRIISLGTASITLGLVLACAVAVFPSLWVGLMALSWVFGGLGMGLATASTSLVVMTLSPSNQQGRNASALQFGEALGASLFVGVAGTLFATLHPLGNGPATFGAVFAAMAVLAAGALAVSLRIGPIVNELHSSHGPEPSASPKTGPAEG